MAGRAGLGALPEDALLEVLARVPARDLVRSCRLVCAQWRAVVDRPSLWKRKCEREGLVPAVAARPPPDWRVWYFLCRRRRNLLRNPRAQEKFKHWKLDSNGGDKWKVEELPGTHGNSFPSPAVRKYFVTSYDLCLKSQIIDLKKEGYWEELMDKHRPDIVVSDWYAARFDCGCRYQLKVQLLSADYLVLDEFRPEPVIIDQWSDAEWKEMSHTFRNYKPGVRYILFKHGGQDTQFWAGWYGIRVTNSSITIGPETSA
ncbi:F-box only protein 6 isoform X1 [Alligator mississippiensis]|uniref:F-box only protein 6 n=1 Tax=Alligator mississippiensis TaxID=8496 RepID=A0A151N3T7_ALLMI|nr:F-box only protein 6 isoform X1 [Alligator mississippiensis]KYO31471.1 F-box only protein 6 [Alligator mississippiensis]